VTSRVEEICRGLSLAIEETNLQPMGGPFALLPVMKTSISVANGMLDGCSVTVN